MRQVAARAGQHLGNAKRSRCHCMAMPESRMSCDCKNTLRKRSAFAHRTGICVSGAVLGLWQSRIPQHSNSTADCDFHCAFYSASSACAQAAVHTWSKLRRVVASFEPFQTALPYPSTRALVRLPPVSHRASRHLVEQCEVQIRRGPRITLIGVDRPHRQPPFDAAARLESLFL